MVDDRNQRLHFSRSGAKGEQDETFHVALIDRKSVADIGVSTGFRFYENDAVGPQPTISHERKSGSVLGNVERQWSK